MDQPTPKPTEELRKEEASLIHPSLKLDIEDNLLVRLIETRIKADDEFYNGRLKLDKRRKRMNDFWLGKQIDESQLDLSWQIPYVDNIIWRDLETRIGIAAARLPEIIVIPPSDDPTTRERAKKVEDGLTIRVLNDDIRRLVKDGIRDNHLNFTGVIKIPWDPNRGENGDFVFEKIDPRKIGMDHTATIPHDGYTADNMELIYEWIEEPVGVVMAKFPDKREELKKRLKIILGTTQQMAAKMRYLEVWFTWFDKDGTRQEGVCWKYKNMILDKAKNPYYDWEGVEKPTQDENGLPITKTVYQNFFERPRKPYIFFTHQNLGNSPIDDTTAVEQAIPIQRNTNKRGRQITEIADNAVPKKVFNGNFITKEEARRVSQDPGEHVWLDGSGGNLDDVRKAFGTIESAPPSPMLYDDLIANRGEIDSMFSTHSTTRGETQPQQSGIAKQITREGDLTISDDLVETMVVRVISEMAGWALQMMKTMYNKEHYLRSMGKDGEMVSLSLAQDSIDEGISLKVKASTIDKVRRRGEAMELATSKSIDPLTLFEDMDVPNPKERAQRLIAFMRGEMDGYAAYEQVTGLAGGKEGAPQGQPGAPGLTAAQAQQDIQSLMAGQPVEPQGMPTAEYVQAFMDFSNSGQLEQLPPEVHQNFLQYIQKLKAMIAQQAGGQVGVPTAAPPSAPMTAQPPATTMTPAVPEGGSPQPTI